jgi:oligopeptidase B
MATPTTTPPTAPSPGISADPNEPRAPRRPHKLVAHGDERIDDWFWLRDREDPEVIAYLEAENAYTKAAMAPTEDFQERLYAQIRSRIQETDISAPARKGPWWYYSRTVEGQQYAIHCRRSDPDRSMTTLTVLAAAERGEPGEEVLLDENAASAGHDYFALGVFDVSPDHAILAYAIDTTGGERFSLRFRDLVGGTDLEGEIDDVYYSSAWAADSRTFFYVRPDEAVRPFQVWRHTLGQPASADVNVYQEDDERFFVGVGLTHSERYLLVSTESKTTSEVRFLETDTPAEPLRLVEPRHQGVEYDVEHAIYPDRGDLFLVLTNADGAEDFALHEVPVATPAKANWRIVLPHRPGVKLESVDAFAAHVVISERENALERLLIIRVADGDQHVIEQPEPVYSLTGAANPEFDSTVLRFGYTSLTTPVSAIEYDLEARIRTTVKQQPVLGGYDSSAYETARLWASAPDGVKVPISLVHRRGLALDGAAPCLLYGYGAYEISIDPTFSTLRLNLLDRGFVFAIAHIRGGGELGRRWYEDGKLLKKRNTFTDFIACAEHLIDLGYTSSDRLVIRGGSAGGLLMGAVANMRPELWHAVVAQVPFVDCLTTMQDESLPLTITEWEEWGNPAADPEVYFYMKSYSPYDNVAETAYPAMYVTGGLNDPRVGFWEPAKWVAKLRALRTDRPPLLLKTEMEAGHGGPSGRYHSWRDEAQVQAFVLTSVGIDT